MVSISRRDVFERRAFAGELPCEEEGVAVDAGEDADLEMHDLYSAKLARWDCSAISSMMLRTIESSCMSSLSACDYMVLILT